MSCDSYGFYLVKDTDKKPATLRWKHDKNAVGSVATTSKSAESHAERVAYNALPVGANNVYLVIQDAFPCYDKCTNWFLNKTKTIVGLGIIIKVTADNTYDGNSYKVAGYITGLTSFPYYLFYYNGTLTINTTGTAPTGFPVCPTPVSVS